MMTRSFSSAKASSSKASTGLPCASSRERSQLHAHGRALGSNADPDAHSPCAGSARELRLGPAFDVARANLEDDALKKSSSMSKSRDAAGDIDRKPHSGERSHELLPVQLHTPAARARGKLDADAGMADVSQIVMSGAVAAVFARLSRPSAACRARFRDARARGVVLAHGDPWGRVDCINRAILGSTSGRSKRRAERLTKGRARVISPGVGVRR